MKSKFNIFLRWKKKKDTEGKKNNEKNNRRYEFVGGEVNERFNGKISRAKKVHSSLSLFFHLRPVTLNSNSSQRVRVSSFLPFSLPFPPKITFPRFSLAINLSLCIFAIRVRLRSFPHFLYLLLPFFLCCFLIRASLLLFFVCGFWFWFWLVQMCNWSRSSWRRRRSWRGRVIGSSGEDLRLSSSCFFFPFLSS